ncbi:hypothetical protein D3C81_1380110 [compost metagenome]
MRHVPEIVETQDSFKKGRLIILHLGKLLDQIHSFNPDMTALIQAAIEKNEKVTHQMALNE